MKNENKKIFMLNRWKYFKQFKQKHEKFREEVTSKRRLMKEWHTIY